MLVRSTRNCPNSPRVLLALEELGVDYQIEVVEDGTFSATWGSPGPSIHDGDAVVVEPGAILRHLVRRSGGKLWPATLAGQADADRWIEFQSRRLSRAVETNQLDEMTRLLGFVEAQLGKTAWLAGVDFTIADVAYSLLAHPHAAQRMPMLASLPNLTAYLGRIRDRPTFDRANARVPR